MGSGSSKACEAGAETVLAAMVAWAASSSNPSIRGELQSLNAGMLKTDSESIVKKLAQTLATGPGKNKTSKGKSNEKATGKQSKGTKSEKKTQGSGTGDQASKEGRKKSECAPDESSDTSDMYTIRSLSYHFKKRMTRIVRLAAMGQFVSEQTSVFRQELLIGGRSQFQDRSSHISGYHAAHVVRVKIDRLNEQSDYFTMLKNFLGHTHLVERYANVWHGVGGKIDRIQSGFIRELNEINFQVSLTLQVQDILERMKAAFLTVFLNAIFSEELNEEQLNDLTDVVETLQEISIYDMFMKGKTWYEGKYLELNYCSDSDTDSE
ncbi:uncharacterized protein LOC6045020 [Culex quinquefasciatus]|uniref:uncharacterized protein LOC6045020 n=1 Tax=Culex quinquefasciatus TaxID=7176 RepID=UPI0018E352D5|nr:uncharacterized protein LOC6045020 [Culex quinquefasciatus]